MQKQTPDHGLLSCVSQSPINSFIYLFESKVTGFIGVIESRTPEEGGGPKRGMPWFLLSRVFMGLICVYR